jgi:hypothetical protein
MQVLSEKLCDLVLKPWYTSQFVAGRAAATILANVVPGIHFRHVHDFYRPIGRYCGSFPHMRIPSPHVDFFFFPFLGSSPPTPASV